MNNVDVLEILGEGLKQLNNQIELLQKADDYSPCEVTKAIASALAEKRRLSVEMRKFEDFQKIIAHKVFAKLSQIATVKGDKLTMLREDFNEIAQSFEC